MARNIVLVGAPGSGKGTQAKKLEADLSMVQISTGDILRQAVSDQTELGKKAKSFMDGGKLVPDELIVAIIEARIQEDDARTAGWIMDGFPRTLPQAKAFGQMLEAANMKIDCVPVLDVPDAVLTTRITGRRSCKSCGAVFHTEFMPPSKEGVCDHCGAEALYQRSDDKEDKVRVRLEAFQSMVNEVIPHYEAQGLVARIDGNRGADEVYQDLKALLQ